MYHAKKMDTENCASSGRWNLRRSDSAGATSADDTEAHHQPEAGTDRGLGIANPVKLMGQSAYS